jgi:hypothetical protein
MGDSQRAIGVGIQSARGTPASTIHWLDFVENFSHKPNLKKDIPKFVTGTRWMERRAKSQTRFDEVTINGRVDNLYFGYWLFSGFSKPTTSSGDHTFIAGSAYTIALTPYLTVEWSEGLNQTWQMIDGRVTKLSMSIDATGNVTYSATVRGIKAHTITFVTPTITLAADDVDFQPFQVALNRGSGDYCVTAFKWDLDNRFDPFYCLPNVAPLVGAEHGLYPTRFTDGEVTGTFDLSGEYLGDATSPYSAYYNFTHDIDESYTISMTDPDTAGAPELLITLPKVAGTDGEIDRSKPNVLQHVRGSILDDDTLGSGMSILLHNSLTSYA